MNFFSERTGRVVLVPDVGFPLTVVMEGWPGGARMKSIITSVSISSQGSFQFMQSLRNLIYVYVFGEKIGEIEIGGLSFAGYCDENRQPTGLELVWRYYLRHRISNRGAPVSIAVGVDLTFRGWLTAFRVAATDPNSGLSQFSMRFNFFPGHLITNPDSTTDFLDAGDSSAGADFDFPDLGDSLGGGGPDLAFEEDSSGGGGFDLFDPSTLQAPISPLDLVDRSTLGNPLLIGGTDLIASPGRKRPAITTEPVHTRTDPTFVAVE